MMMNDDHPFDDPFENEEEKKGFQCDEAGLVNVIFAMHCRKIHPHDNQNNENRQD